MYKKFATLFILMLSTVVMAVDELALTVEGSPIFCAPLAVKIVAKQNQQTVTDYTGTITVRVNTQNVAWDKVKGNGNFVSNNDNEANYTYVASDKGQVTLSLLVREGQSKVVITAYDHNNPNIRNKPPKNRLTFEAQGFHIKRLSDQGDVDHLAGKIDKWLIEMIGFDRELNTCGVIEQYTGEKELAFWIENINPDVGFVQYNLGGTQIASAEEEALPQSVMFSDGRARLDGHYRDVGKIQLFAKSGRIKGNSKPFVVKPAKFTIAVSENPAAGNHNGPVFRKAGEPFAVTVNAQDIDGNTVPNFGNERPAQSIELKAAELVLPSEGRLGSDNQGVLGNGDKLSRITDGTFEADDITFDEVGIIKLIAGVKGQDYLGAGDASGPLSEPVGRFVPDHFTVEHNIPSFEAACTVGGFTYLGQPFKFAEPVKITATARSVSGVVTENYTGDFWRLVPDGLNPTYQHNSPVELQVTNGGTTIAMTDLGKGQGEIILGQGDSLTFERSSGFLVAPFSADIGLEVTIRDLDNVAYTSNPLSFGSSNTGQGIAFVGGKTFMLGRMFLGNAFGSELKQLTVPIQAQYFNGNDFEVNTLDSCTVFDDVNHLKLKAEPDHLQTNPKLISFINGFGLFTLSPPSPAGITGQVNIEADLSIGASNLPHLQYDWPFDANSDGNYDDNPRARATFGVYQGDDEIIYTQELFQ